MKTVESFVKRAKDVLDPKTNKSFKIVMWPLTTQMTHIPIAKHFYDGSLDNMEFCVYDKATTTTVIKFPTDIFRLVEARDLLQFGERDIHTLARHQIVVKTEILESAAKEFTGTVAKSISKKMWLGAMGRSDVLTIEKD
ncbi:hypothetical protein Lser_V15G23264 [Lactuca serriola]